MKVVVKVLIDGKQEYLRYIEDIDKILSAFALGEIKQGSLDDFLVRFLVKLNPAIEQELKALKGTVELVKTAEVEPPPELLEELLAIPGKG